MDSNRVFFAVGMVEGGHLVLDELQPEADFLEGCVVEVRLALANKEQIAAFAQAQVHLEGVRRKKA